ncbi:hypothetical protein ACKWTF_013014 [Chironomus riparius]
MENDKEVKVHTADVIVAENYQFTKFLLSEKLLKALNEMNYFKPSPIQLKIIPLARSRLDMIIQSKSGTGKTLSFSICLLETYDEDLKFPQALIIVPTREIAVQITNTLNGLGKYMKYFKACEFIGGTDLKNDRKKIQTAKIVVGTPGRVLHLIKNEIFNVSNIKAIVFDEADKLFEQGHLGKDVQTIFKMLNHKNLQIIAATATVTKQFENQIKKHMKNPLGISPKQEAPILLGIKQFALELPEENDNIKLMRHKLVELEKIFTKITFKQCLLFTDSQYKTESYGNYLNKLGWKNEIINGSQEQSQRLKVLNKLAKFKCRILITTDLMARGIDIENINLVINLDLPYDCFTYLHRIGRAGRFGTHGIAITILNGEKDGIKFKKMLGDIGSHDSMVYKFPDDSMTFNFWEFNDQEQVKKLSKIDAIPGSQNGYENDSIVDENLMLLEITRKLVDQKPDEGSNNFDTDALLKEYESSCMKTNEDTDTKNLLDDYEKSTGNTTNGYSSDYDTNTVKEISRNNKLTSERNNKKMETSNRSSNSNIDELLKEYELLSQSNGNANNNEVQNEYKYPEIVVNGCKDTQDVKTSPEKVTKNTIAPSKSPKDKRCIIFVRNPEDDEDQHSMESDTTETENNETDSESVDTESESEKEVDDEESQDDEDPQENYREFAQLHQDDDEYQVYNNYVMDNYLQWRRTFYFQMANIQNFVNPNREDFV